MKSSKTAFLKKDAEGAANDLRHAAEIVRRAIDDAVDVPKVLLEESARELERLSRDVAYGTVDSVKALDHAFARTQHALATHYHEVASKSLGTNELSRAGHALGASVKAFGHAIEWSGEKLEEGVKLTIDSALLLSGKLIEGTGFVAKEAGELVADLGNEIEKFGIMVDPYSNN
jgi:hypothetical protein